MRHFFFPALALPLLVIACNARVVPNDPSGNDGQNLTNGGHNGADAGAPEPGCGTTDAGIGDASAGDAGRWGSCGDPDGTLRTFTSASDMLARVQGRWLGCSGFIWQPAGTIGIEFEGSQAWFLVDGPHGTAVRGAGPDYRRTVTIIDDVSMNGPGAYRFQMDLSTPNGFDTYFLDSFDNPSKLVLNEGTSGNIGVYAPMSASGVIDAGVYDAGSYDGGVYDSGAYDAGSYDGGVYDSGPSQDAGFEGDGDIFSDGGWTSGDGGFEDAPSSSCALVGTWDVTSNVPFGNLSSFVFSSNGTFIGGPRGALLPTGETFSGDWDIAPDGQVSISNTTGMLCNAGPTNMSLTYGADCATVTLQVVTDACTGAREQLDDTTVLARR